MFSRVLAICVLSAALGLVAVLPSSTTVEGGTFKTTHGLTLGCNGPDGVAATGDDTCTCVGGGANALDQCADVAGDFDIPPTAWGDPDYANIVRAIGFPAPPESRVSLDSDVPHGAYAALLYTVRTLSILNAPCPSSPNIVTHIPLYRCSIDNSLGNQTNWTGDGSNLTQDNNADTLPDGCDMYPAHVDASLGGLKPRLRLYGFSNVVAGAPAAQVNFVVLSPGQLTQLGALPFADMGDSLGYANILFLDNLLAPPPGMPEPSSITDVCNPLATDTTFFGLTGGQGVLVPPEGSNPELGAQCTRWQGTNNIGIDNDADTVADDGCWVVQDWCGDGAGSDPLCGLVQYRNPTALGTGIYATDTHLAGGYVESQRDADADGLDNNVDTCPFDVDTGTDNDGDGIDSACDPDDGAPNHDQDGDDFLNRQDLCPLVYDDQTDTDGDAIGDACDPDPGTPDGPFLNDVYRNGICVGGTDTDGDGWCDDTETLLGSHLSTTPEGAGEYGPALCSDNADNDGDTFIDLGDAGCCTPEYYGIDYPITAAETPPGAAPGTCNDLSWYATAGDPNGSGFMVDNDGDTIVNSSEPECTCDTGVDTDCDGVCDGAKSGFCAAGNDNCLDDPNPEQLDTDDDTAGNACDADDDGDGLPDAGDLAPLDPDADDDNISDGPVDPDGGGPIDPGPDNCPLAANTDQTDSDSDLVGNVCDNCPDDPNAGQEDADRDDVGDACDNCPNDANTGQDDGDSDDLGDVCDNCPGDYNPGQTNTDVIVNPPGDPLGDACDPDDDDDAWEDDDEIIITTDPLDNCADQPDDNDAWPPDNAGPTGCGYPDTNANILDVSCYKPKLPPNPYDPRYDLDASGAVNILDVLMYKPVLNTSCTNP